MKTLFLCQNLRVGGAEELVLQSSTELRATGIDAGVVAITRRGPIAEEIERAGVPVHLATGQPGPRDSAAFVRLTRLLRREQPDVVHAFLLNATLYGRLAAFAAGVPLVLAAEQNVYRHKRRRHAAMERLLAARTYRVVACCRTVGDFYRRQVRVPASKIAVIYNAARFGPIPGPADRGPAREQLGVPPDALVVGTLGRLAEQKDHRSLIRVVARLAPHVPRLVLLIAGDGPLRAELEREAAGLGVAERVRFLGIRRDRETLFAAMDLFALPSRWEGLSLALVEAMGAARAVVATSVGGNPEVVDNGRTGLLVPPNDESALGDAIETLLLDDHLRDSLRTAASEEAHARFSIERHASQLVTLYRQGQTERATKRPPTLRASL